MNVPIVQKGDPVLRVVAAEIPQYEIKSERIQDVISRMKDALDSQDDGLAIAAPQIGEPLRIFIISGKVFSGLIENGETVDLSKPKEVPDMIFINPVVTKLSKRKKMMSEGCLSVRNFYGNVSRSSKATVRAFNEKGESFERGGAGIIAQIFQHEIDHLDGILFVDKANDIEEIQPEQ